MLAEIWAENGLTGDGVEQKARIHCRRRFGDDIMPMWCEHGF